MGSKMVWSYLGFRVVGRVYELQSKLLKGGYIGDYKGGLHRQRLAVILAASMLEIWNRHSLFDEAME